MLILDEIKHKMKSYGISQKEIAVMLGVPYQNISSMLNGKREIPLSISINMDQILRFSPGYIEQEICKEKIKDKIQHRSLSPYEINKQIILEKIKDNGGFWSYKEIPETLNDDEIIEEALLNLDFEDMYLIFKTWSYSHIKKIWKNKLVSQGKRLNVINTLLNIIFFNHGTEYNNS